MIFNEYKSLDKLSISIDNDIWLLLKLTLYIFFSIEDRMSSSAIELFILKSNSW